MILTIIVIVFVIGLTMLHALWGLFSGVINVFCSIVAAAIAFGFFGPLTALLAAQGLHPAWTEPSVFVGLFVVALAALRFAADNYIRGNVRLPMLVDWIGGAVCGLFNAQVAVGMLVIGFYMLPMGGTSLMFTRFERVGEVSAGGFAEFKRNSASFLKPDEFVSGMFAWLSSTSLQGGNVVSEEHPNRSFSSVYPDFTQWVFWSGNTVQTESSPTALPKDDAWTRGVTVQQWWRQDSVVARYREAVPSYENRRELGFRPPETYQPGPGRTLLGIRANFNRAAAEQGRSAAHRFRPSMIRLVGAVGDEPAHFIPRVIGGLPVIEPEAHTPRRIVDLDNNITTPPDVEFDLFFDTPDNFEPWFLEYRRHVRTELSAPPAESPPALLGEELTPAADTAAANTPDARPSEPTAGERRGAFGGLEEVIVDRSGFDINTPVRFATSALQDFEADGRAIKTGRAAGFVEQLRGSLGAVNDYWAPAGQRVLVVATRPFAPGSLLGQVANFAGSNTSQYFAATDRGQRYPLRGYYGVVDRDGQPYIEFFYAGDPDSPQGLSFRGMTDFKAIAPEIRRSQGTAEVGLIFHVPPGEVITEVVNQRGQGITGLNFE